MRSNETIKVTMKIPFPINKPDGNGFIYTKEAIENAVKKFDGGAPLMIVKDDIGTVVGHIETLELSDNYEVTAHGVCYFGGTDEYSIVENNTIKEFEFLSFGISEV